MFKRLLEQIDNLIIFAAVSLMFGLIKLVVSKENSSLRQRVATIFLSVCVGTLSGALVLEYGFKDYTALTVSSVGSLLSRDLVTGILNKDYVSTLFKRASENLVDKVTK